MLRKVVSKQAKIVFKCFIFYDFLVINILFSICCFGGYQHFAIMPFGAGIFICPIFADASLHSAIKIFTQVR